MQALSRLSDLGKKFTLVPLYALCYIFMSIVDRLQRLLSLALQRIQHLETQVSWKDKDKLVVVMTYDFEITAKSYNIMLRLIFVCSHLGTSFKSLKK